MNNIETIIVQILDIFQQFRMNPTPIDQYETVGKSLLADKIKTFVSAGTPIEFVMLGYPMKSVNNRDKVLGILPDKAEEVSIENFDSFNKLVKQFYTPGVHINIVNDGLVFNDLLEVSDRTVDTYKDVITDMSSNKCITYYTLKDFYKRNLYIPDMRMHLMSDFGITNEKLERRILFDPDVNYLYRGMIRFMQEELSIKQFVSGNQLHKASKILTRNMMLRNEAYSNLVKKEFSSYIRLSMHPSINNGNKYSFQLVRGENVIHSPWHSALLVKANGAYTTIHKKDAIASNYQLIYENNQPYYFKEL